MGSDQLEKARAVVATLSPDELATFAEELQIQLYGQELSEDELDASMAPIIHTRLSDPGPAIPADQVKAELKSRFGD